MEEKKTFLKISEEELKKVVILIDKLRLAEGQNFYNSSIINSVAHILNSCEVIEDKDAGIDA